MKSITPRVFIIVIGIVLARKLVTGSCEEACCMQQKSAGRSNPNVTEAFIRCCNESTECVLPIQFYNLSCRNQLMKFCFSTNGSRTTTNLTRSLNTECCSKVNCTETKDNRRKCSSITVDWRQVNFLPKLDLLIQNWDREHWIFFLKMASQRCLNESARSSVKYMYPYYTKHEKKIVVGYQAPPAFLIKRKEYYTMFTVVGDSIQQLWPTLILCVTWSLISGVIIWLLVRLDFKMFIVKI